MVHEAPSASYRRIAWFLTRWRVGFSHPWQRVVRMRHNQERHLGCLVQGWAAILSVLIMGGVVASASAATLATPSHSTTIALTSDETRLIVVNREANTVSIIQVTDAAGNDVAIKLAEIGVGSEPRCVAVHPNNQVAYVTNGISATVSVVDLMLGAVVREVDSGTEPRGCALTPNGNLLYVANHTEGTVSIFFTGNPLNPIPV